jgi:nicotinamide-nucleotide adenylyltransferase
MRSAYLGLVAVHCAKAAPTLTLPVVAACRLLSAMSTSKQRLAEFVQSSDDLRIFHPGPLTTARTICVLDSSFNPPNLAHQTIVQRALKHFSTTDDSTALLLLFATKNADKASPQSILDYCHRLDMMELFAQDVGCDKTSIGLTSHAKFIDKFTCLKKRYPSASRIVFLTGFDTFMRIIDPRYYGGHEPMTRTLELGFFH